MNSEQLKYYLYLFTIIIYLLAVHVTPCRPPDHMIPHPDTDNHTQPSLQGPPPRFASFFAAATSRSRFANSVCRGAFSFANFLFADLFCSTYDMC